MLYTLLLYSSGQDREKVEGIHRVQELFSGNLKY